MTRNLPTLTGNAGDLTLGPSQQPEIIPKKDCVDCCPICLCDAASALLSNSVKSLWRCRECGVIYTHPRPLEKDIRAFFSDKYISTEEDVDIRFGIRPEQYLRKVANFIHSRKQSGRILDIGCAGGHFLSRFFDDSAWDRWGVDLSKFAAARARAKSLRVQAGDIHSTQLPASRFDVATVLDTIFYFREPLRELARIKELLRPDGLLVITTPCANVHIWRNTGWRKQLFSKPRSSLLDTHHLFFYNAQSLKSLLRRSHFDISAVCPLPAIDQGSAYRNFLAKSYFVVSAALAKASCSRLMFAPRYMIAAVPAN